MPHLLRYTFCDSQYIQCLAEYMLLPIIPHAVLVFLILSLSDKGPYRYIGEPARITEY